jgi:hypothetical protein
VDSQFICLNICLVLVIFFLLSCSGNFEPILYESREELSSSSSEMASSSSSEDVSSSSSEQSDSSSSVGLCGGFEDTTSFCDERDGNVYFYVTINKQIWMAKNLNYGVYGSECYNNISDNCGIYGRLYNWETAKDACPSGWRLPNSVELNIFKSGESEIGIYDFSFLPGGYKNNNEFTEADINGYWWSSTTEHDEKTAVCLIYDKNNQDVKFSVGNPLKSYFLSVRCVKDKSN